jgi:hypothetical protein
VLLCLAVLISSITNRGQRHGGAALTKKSTSPADGSIHLLRPAQQSPPKWPAQTPTIVRAANNNSHLNYPARTPNEPPQRAYRPNHRASVPRNIKESYSALGTPFRNWDPRPAKSTEPPARPLTIERVPTHHITSTTKRTSRLFHHLLLGVVTHDYHRRKHI